MSLLDTASLIVTPNGYKEGKLYSVIPSDGSGDLSVTRATTATRVNSAGLVELVPYNLLTWSEDLSTSDWTKLNVSITANSTTAPNGTLTADTLTNSSTGYGLWQTISVAPSTQYTFSFYVKKGTNTSYILSVIDAGTFSGIASLDYSSQVGTEWVRVSTTFTTLSGTTSIRVYPMRDGSSTGTAFLWGAQLVEGSTAKDYQKTETRLNIPRLDYSNGTCPSILVEPQRTNLITYSEQFNLWNATATGTGVIPVVTSNAAIAPNGLQVADKIFLDSGAGTGSFDWSWIYSNSFTASTIDYTASIYLKGENGGEQVQIRHAASGTYTKLTLTTEWQRFDNLAVGYGGAATFEIAIRRNLNEPINSSATIYAWGAQVEAGSYATSYIPTTSASVTRNADVISKTGISSLIGQTEGAVFIDLNIDSSFAQNDMRFINVGDGTAANWYFIGTNASNQIRFYYRTSNTAYVSFTTTLTNGRHKLAYAYANGDYVAYVDGTLVHSDNTIVVGSASQLNIANDYGSFSPSKQIINAVALWKTRLTNTQLAQLTTI
jgi:hypothetical protein